MLAWDTYRSEMLTATRHALAERQLLTPDAAAALLVAAWEG